MFHIKYLTHISKTALALFIALFLGACGGSGGDSSPPVQPVSYSYKQPNTLNDGWPTAHATDLGIDTSVLEQVMQNIIDERIDFRFIDALVIIKGGQLLLDERIKTSLDFTDDWSGNQDVNLHIINSVTKSFASTLVGIAIDQQIISDVNVKVHDFFTDKFPIANWNQQKANITLENWLTMRHGYLWDEWNVSYLDSSNLNSQMNASADPIQFLLDRPMATIPGTSFAYSTGVSFGLGRIVQLASNMDLNLYMEQYLFQPLQINNYDFWALDGQLHTGSSLYLSNRDMAKLGQLFLDKGLWNGTRVVSESWVDEATQIHYDNGNWGYGYQWWMRNFVAAGQILKCYYADGFGGQYIFVFPEINAIIAFQGSAYTDEESAQRDVSRIMEQFLLPQLL